MSVVLISRMNDDAARRKTQFLCLIDGYVMKLDKGKDLYFMKIKANHERKNSHSVWRKKWVG